MPSQYKHLLGGPSLKVDLHTGAIAEGVLTFLISFLVLVIILRGPRSPFLKTLLLAVVTVALVVAGSVYTGPSMNPANVRKPCPLFFCFALSFQSHNVIFPLFPYSHIPYQYQLVALISILIHFNTSPPSQSCKICTLFSKWFYCDSAKYASNKFIVSTC
jgi:glycerol uptake facilitator-like aquaporin